MIALFGHGYVGSAIARRFLRDGIPFLWRSHVDEMPPAEMYVNAAGYTGVPNVDGCEDHRRETVEGSIDWPLRLARTGVPKIISNSAESC